MTKSADAFRTISEVADWLGIQTHVLRFWESKFTQVKPVKRAGGRRYYRPADMQLLGGIQKLLHEDGLTIKGVQKILREKGMSHVSALSARVDSVEAEPKIDVPEVPVKIDAQPQTAAILPLVPTNKAEETVERLSLTDDETAPEPEEVVQEPVPNTNTVDPAVYDATVEIETEALNPQESADETSFEDPQSFTSEDQFDESIEPHPVLELDEVSSEEDNPIPVMPAFLSRPTQQSSEPETSIIEVTEPAPVAEAGQEAAILEDYTPNVENVEVEASASLSVDLPEPLAENEIETTPRVLTALSKINALTPELANSIAPLLAQLRDARDRMTQDRKE